MAWEEAGRTWKAVMAGIVAAVTVFGVRPALAEEFRFATEGAYPPFNYVDSNRQPQGFDVDIARALCQKMQVKCVIAVQDWDGLIPGLIAAKYDAVIASMQSTPDRAKSVDFTSRYYSSELALAVKKSSTLGDIAPETLKGLRIGAQSGTAMAAYAEDHYMPAGVNIWFYPTAEEANMDMLIGRLDGMVQEKFPLLDWLQKDGRDCCRLLGYAQGTREPISIAIRKNSAALKARLDQAIEDIRADGTYQKISAQYFGADIY
ncbi:MAG: Bacterial extracellular solute-binding protein,family 3 [Candidatus Tokpelaia hoelldobleri]|uniref:Bacterial extracellular solute-binding protein,family 3 n=1 Tax=Candidatus Tokpelaia hoelldobleri TaxID=1902579 RepID=A0A1U9JWM2_9HYPH|nr:MAG: Bacterial extracellular solute-binding protein,family 3 [Candidatus Tokpelaia hoelldoblerii]